MGSGVVVFVPKAVEDRELLLAHDIRVGFPLNFPPDARHLLRQYSLGLGDVGAIRVVLEHLRRLLNS